MKSLAVLLLLGCLSGCSTLETRVDYGYVAQYALGKESNDYVEGVKSNGDPRLGVPFDGHYVFAGIGGSHQESDLRVGVTLGASAVFPTRGPDSEWVGAELRGRLSYTDLPLHPFAEGFAGIGYTTRHRWAGEGTRHLFSVGGTVGLSLPLGAWSVDLGYRFHHLSNGSALGAPGPNAGYNGDMVIIGVERRF